MKKRKLGYWKDEIIFLGPGLLFFGIVVIIPFLMSFYYSLTDWNGVADVAEFIGIGNFIELTKDTEFINSFLFTGKYAVAMVIISNILAFFAALLVTRNIKGKGIYRSIIFVPYMMSGFIIGFVWKFIFTKGFPVLGEVLGWELFNLNWLATPDTGYWGLVIVGVWKQVGYLMVVYIAGFTSVPQEFLEAAEVDGATGWDRLRCIKLPLIMPSVTICLFLSISNAFNVFDLNRSLTNGGPFNSTQAVSLNIYTEAFLRNRYGLGTAKALVFFVVVALISLLQTYLTSRKEVEIA